MTLDHSTLEQLGKLTVLNEQGQPIGIVSRREILSAYYHVEE